MTRPGVSARATGADRHGFPLNAGLVRPAAILFILVCLACLGARSWPTHLLNCDMECGESLLSVHAAAEYAKYGVEFGLLENLGTHEQPLVYTHNVNIGALSFVLLQALGVPDPWKLLLPLAVYGLGLYYVFLTVRRVLDSDLAGLVALCVFGATYWDMGAFALNALRAWHIVAFFAAIFHAQRLVTSRSWLDVAGLLLGAMVAFGCGYDFWIICAAVSGLVALANLPRWTAAALIKTGVTVGLVFGTPFVLRQIHVAGVFGLSYWVKDLIFSVAIKIPYASQLIQIPPLDQIDAFYKSLHILRPPAQPANSGIQIFKTFATMVGAVTVPRWGWLTLLVFIGALSSPLIMVRRASWVLMLKRHVMDPFSRRLLLPAAAGVFVGLVLFAPFSLHVYFKHEFPLAGFLLLLGKSAAVYFALRVLRVHHRLYRPLATMFIVVVLADMAVAHWNNSRHGPALNYGWAKLFSDEPNETVALATYKYEYGMMSAANPFLNIVPERSFYVPYRDVLDAPSRFVVYQPTDRFVDFDSPSPNCRWTGWFRALMGRTPQPQPGVSCIYHTPLVPGAKAQPSLDEFVRTASPRFDVVKRDDYGIGYVILRRKLGSHP